MQHLGEINWRDMYTLAWNKVAFGMEATCVDMKSAYKHLPLNPCECHRTDVSFKEEATLHKSGVPSCGGVEKSANSVAGKVHNWTTEEACCLSSL